jgi:DNA-binding MarR family transcriptional regulator
MPKNNSSSTHGKKVASEKQLSTLVKEPHSALWGRPGFLIRRLHQLHVAVFLEEMSEDAITPIQYGLLSVLADSPGLDQLSLAEELGIDRANVADVLARMETRGLVSRVASEADRRRKYCSATEEGLFFVKKYFGNMQRAQERLLYPLDAAERDTFMELIYRVVEANNNLGRAPMKQTARMAQAKSKVVPQKKPDLKEARKRA